MQDIFTSALNRRISQSNQSRTMQDQSKGHIDFIVDSEGKKTEQAYFTESKSGKWKISTENLRKFATLVQEDASEQTEYKRGRLEFALDKDQNKTNHILFIEDQNGPWLAPLNEVINFLTIHNTIENNKERQNRKTASQAQPQTQSETQPLDMGQILRKTYALVDNYLDKQAKNHTTPDYHKEVETVIHNVQSLFRIAELNNRIRSEQENNPFNQAAQAEGEAQAQEQLYTHQQVKDTLIELKNLITAQKGNNQPKEGIKMSQPIGGQQSSEQQPAQADKQLQAIRDLNQTVTQLGNLIDQKFGLSQHIDQEVVTSQAGSQTKKAYF